MLVMLADVCEADLDTDRDTDTDTDQWEGLAFSRQARRGQLFAPPLADAQSVPLGPWHHSISKLEADLHQSQIPEEHGAALESV